MRSVQITVQVLKAATKWANVTGLVGRDPLVGVPRPRVQSKSMTAWTTDEARSFLEATRDDRLAVRLRRRWHRLAVDCDPRFGDLRHAEIEVDVLPPEAGELSPAQPPSEQKRPGPRAGGRSHSTRP
jgi:site-specific recombinase XerC